MPVLLMTPSAARPFFSKHPPAKRKFSSLVQSLVYLPSFAHHRTRQWRSNPLPSSCPCPDAAQPHSDEQLLPRPKVDPLVNQFDVRKVDLGALLAGFLESLQPATQLVRIRLNLEPSIVFCGDLEADYKASQARAILGTLERLNSFVVEAIQEFDNVLCPLVGVSTVGARWAALLVNSSRSCLLTRARGLSDVTRWLGCSLMLG